MQRFIIFIFVCFFGAQTAYGATPATEETGPLPAVLVSASGEPSEMRQIPATVQVITQSQLAQTGATTLEKVLERYVPGSGAIQPGAYASIGMRGFRSGQSAGSTIGDRVLILIDGHRAGTGNPGFIPIAAVERVEILRGPMSVLYGGSAMGGVVNVITKRGTGPMQGFLGANYGSYGKNSVDAGVSGGLEGDRWGYSLAAQQSGAEDYRDATGTRYANTAWRKAGAGATATYRPQSNTQFSVVGLHDSQFATGSPGYYPKGLTPEDTTGNTYNYLALEHESAPGEDVTLRAGVYGNQNRYRYYSASWVPEDSVYRAQTLGGRAVLGVPFFGLGRLAMGTDYAHIQEDNYGQARYQPNAAYDVLGFFGEHTLDLGPVVLKNGVRYDSYHSGIQETPGLEAQAASRTYSHVSWSSGTTWWMQDWLGIRMGVGTAFVPPTAKSLAGRFNTGGLWGMEYRGNPDLVAEKSMTGEVGLEVEQGALRASLAYFYTKYTDRIVERYLTDYATYANIGNQRLGGVNALLNYTRAFDVGLPKKLSFTPRINGEYFTQRSNNDFAKSTEIAMYVPRYTALVGLETGYGIVSLDVNARTTGSQLQYDTSTFKPATMPGYTVYNARLTVTPLENLSVYTEVENIADKYYAYTAGYPMPGRAVSLGFRYTF